MSRRGTARVHEPAPELGRARHLEPSAGGDAGLTQPLTERILAALPGSRLGLIVAWALLPWVNLAVVVSAEALDWSDPTDHSTEVLNRAAVSFAILLSLWGATRISVALAGLRPALAEVIDQELPEVERLFRGLDSAAVPLTLTVLVGVLLPLDEALNDDPVAAAVQAVTWLLVGIPLCTAVWVYVVLQLGLHRLGRGQVTLAGYRGDRTLGLQAVGSLAFTGFWMLLGTLTPLAVTGTADRPAVLVTTGVLLAGVALFFLSLHGLHRQMSVIRRRELDRARVLYQQAYQPVQKEPSLAVLEQQAGKPQRS